MRVPSLFSVVRQGLFNRYLLHWPTANRIDCCPNTCWWRGCWYSTPTSYMRTESLPIGAFTGQSQSLLVLVQFCPCYLCMTSVSLPEHDTRGSSVEYDSYRYMYQILLWRSRGLSLRFPAYHILSPYDCFTYCCCPRYQLCGPPVFGERSRHPWARL